MVVVPIASACVAIISIAFGIGLYVYTRRKSGLTKQLIHLKINLNQIFFKSFSLRIEVADFNFEEEEAPEMSFFERLQSSIVQYWTGLRNQEQPNPAYQSITFD